MKKLSFFVLLIPMMFFACQQEKNKINLEEETLAVESVLENYIIANETQSPEMIQSLWAPESDIILYGTDSHERLMGWTNINAAFKDQFEQITDTYIAASNQYIKIGESAKTAWFAETLNYNFIYQDEARKYEGLRFTGVMSKFDGNWRIVQAHLSVPASVGVSN